MLTIRITPNESSNPPGKLADAELHFHDGPLAGLKLIGFAVWERRTGSGRNVTVPARQYTVNGERRSYALLRPITDPTAQNAIRDAILQAYAEQAGELTIEQPATGCTLQPTCKYCGRRTLNFPDACDACVQHQTDEACAQDTTTPTTDLPLGF